MKRKKEAKEQKCTTMVREHKEIDDLFPEVLAKLWQGLDSFRGEIINRIENWPDCSSGNEQIGSSWHAPYTQSVSP